MSVGPTPAVQVWVVDDDIELRMALSRLLQSVGLQVTTSASALEFFEQQRLDGGGGLAEVGCVLTDVRMPGMTGIELVQCLQQHILRPPVIVMTMHGDAPSAVRAMKAGAFDFIEKPLRELELIELLHKAIRHGQRHRVKQEQRQRAIDALATLTRRESEVLQAVVIGRMNKEIALTLDISVRTVELHRANVMTKTACSTLPELVTLVLTARCGEDDDGAAR